MRTGGLAPTFRSLRSPPSIPPPVPVAASSASSFTIRVIFDQQLQTGAGSPAPMFPDAVSNRPGFSRRNLQPGASWAVQAALPDRVQLTNGAAPTTTLPGRIRYDPALGQVLVGTTGVPVEPFDLTVPFP